MSTIIGLPRNVSSRAHGYGHHKFKFLVLSSLIVLPMLLSVAGCISSSNPPPPSHTTVVVPGNATVVCSDGLSPPCR